MLHREEILILQQANEILQRHNLGGTYLPVQYLSQEINDFIFNHPQYGQRIDKTPLEHLCDFYEANPKYLENDQEFPTTIQFAFFPHNEAIQYMPAFDTEVLIGDSPTPLEYHVWEYPLVITFQEDTLLWELETKPKEMKPIKGAYYKNDIIKGNWPSVIEMIGHQAIGNIYGHNLLRDEIKKHLLAWLIKHPLVYELITQKQ